jgi:hypothetical protein
MLMPDSDLVQNQQYCHRIGFRRAFVHAHTNGSQNWIPVAVKERVDHRQERQLVSNGASVGSKQVAGAPAHSLGDIRPDMCQFT